MITDYYVDKDDCAYVQVADSIMQFKEDFNPLCLPKMPIFEEAITKYKINILVNDNLTKISLHIKALKMN